ncbi:YqjY [Bacillus pumilus ATCC 7061]|nr:YqjY [Bacillus pumilus ATCC 7061]
MKQQFFVKKESGKPKMKRGEVIMIRQVKPSDFYAVTSVIQSWWGGKDLRATLPKLFFEHFQQTSFVVVEKGELIGFLVGFLSQSRSDEAYIHFVGVHPDHRKLKIGKMLYQAFYDVAKQEGRTTIKVVTAPVNKVSIAYHAKLGFQIEKGDKTVEGISVFSEYEGINEDRVLFVKKLEAMS